MQRVYGRFIISTCNAYNLLHNYPQFLLYSTSSSSSSTDDFANYLINSLGFSNTKAINTSTKHSKYKKVNDFNFSANAISVVNLFKNHGFADTDIEKIASVCPRLLTVNAEKIIRPKLGFLQNQGISGLDLIRVISLNPSILQYRVESRILPVLQILRDILGCDAHVVTIMKRLRRGNFVGVICYLSQNVELLRTYGTSIECIRKHLVQSPSAFVREPDVFKDIVIRVEKKFGIVPGSTMFLYGVQLLSGYSEATIESKCRVFKSFGWTQSDIDNIMRNLSCFSLSDESIRKKLDFLMNELGLDPAHLTSCTGLLTCSLEKRLVPRHNVLLVLKAKGLLKKNPTFYSAVSVSESRFVNTFVLPFKEVHQVYAEHTGCNVMTLIQQRADELQ
ncbi:hypothetical protein RND81_01G024200 [Saponaria officinalis]|uniref:Uncharacterized protein n=1 Tax=Saponaria officinalis TaxID=3572 RepID=A0AAW1NDJ4_SAPOF